MADEWVPYHDLSSIQQLCRWRWRRITIHASVDAQRLGFDEDDIDECVLALKPENFYKSIVTDRGRHQDVYRTVFCEQRVYMKLDMDPQFATVISFEEDTSK